MTRPIIGIIGRKDEKFSTIKRKGNIVLYDYISSLDKEEASYIGLITNANYDLVDENILNLCDGILMPGGVEIKTYHIKMIEYALKNRIPFLGICQGSQALGLSTLTGAKLLKIDDGYSEVTHSFEMTCEEDLAKLVHNVYLSDDSLLYNLFGGTIKVNSNHHYVLPKVELPMKIVGKAEDGVIEAIEHIDPTVFAVGVQWHPENMESMQPLFKEFVDRSKMRKEAK